MKLVAAISLSLVVIAPAASAGTFGSSAGTLRPPAPPRPPASPGYRSGEGGFKPWKPTVRVDSPRGGVDAYPRAKKPKGYISPY
jgi:hypothetical protein